MMEIFTQIQNLHADIQEKQQQLLEYETRIFDLYYVNLVHHVVTQLAALIKQNKAFYFFQQQQQTRNKFEIATMYELLHNQFDLTTYAEKQLFDDFVYLYIDSKQLPRLLFPVQSFCFKLYNDIADAEMIKIPYDKIQQYQQSNKNLIVFVDSMHQIQTLYQQGFALIIGFVLADNLRKLHAKAKMEMISIINLEHPNINPQLRAEIKQLQEVAKYFIQKIGEINS